MPLTRSYEDTGFYMKVRKRPIQVAPREVLLRPGLCASELPQVQAFTQMPASMGKQ